MYLTSVYTKRLRCAGENLLDYIPSLADDVTRKSAIIVKYSNNLDSDLDSDSDSDSDLDLDSDLDSDSDLDTNLGLDSESEYHKLNWGKVGTEIEPGQNEGYEMFSASCPAVVPSLLHIFNHESTARSDKVTVCVVLDNDLYKVETLIHDPTSSTILRVHQTRVLNTGSSRTMKASLSQVRRDHLAFEEEQWATKISCDSRSLCVLLLLVLTHLVLIL
ncbi:hypothetical protein DFH29DRAFT_1022272 [Suillus ampliporus]|nr:hypothetical protein DFH29DRAFT_1022272 [Suillus ampliporus]